MFVRIIIIGFSVGFQGGSVVHNPPANAGDLGFICGPGRSSRGGNGHGLQYSCLENPMDRGAWWATVHGGSQRVPGVMTEHAHITPF